MVQIPFKCVCVCVFVCHLYVLARFVLFFPAQSRHTASISSNKHLQQASGKLRKKIAFLRAESNLENSKMSCVCLDRLAQKTTQCCELISSLISPLRNLEEPPRQSILANVIRHKAFEATIMLAVIANTVFIAYETNYEMENLGEILLVGQVVEIVFFGLLLAGNWPEIMGARLVFFSQ